MLKSQDITKATATQPSDFIVLILKMLSTFYEPRISWVNIVGMALLCRLACGCQPHPLRAVRASIGCLLAALSRLAPSKRRSWPIQWAPGSCGPVVSSNGTPVAFDQRAAVDLSVSASHTTPSRCRVGCDLANGLLKPARLALSAVRRLRRLPRAESVRFCSRPGRSQTR